jgi:hypothetical protein
VLRSAATNTESPSAFAANLAGRRPMVAPDVQGLLFADPATAQAVQDLTQTGASLGAAERYAAQPPTAEGGLGRILPAIEMTKLGFHMAGVPGAAIGLPLGFLAPNLLAGAARRVALNPQLAAVMAASGYAPTGPSNPLWRTAEQYAQRVAVPPQPLPAFSLLNSSLPPAGQ